MPGIGPTFARAIVDHFGAEHVFAELDGDPERLREVRTKAGRAISRKAVDRAVAAWREVAAIREVETFLFAHGIGAGLAARLVRTYGGDVVAILTDDPYRLTEVPRIGFRVADRIARSLGIELDAPQRLRAGLCFVLDDAASDGNAFLPHDELWRAAARLLEVHDVEPLEAALRRLVLDGELVAEGERVYRAELWETEQRLGAALGERARAEDAELFEPPRRPDGVDVSDEQWSVVELVRTRPLVLLTGLPGAGKTHTQRVLVDAARRSGVRVLLCAPTGKAARRMRDLTGHDAMTIHRALGYSPKEDRFLRDEDDPLSNDVELVIVDEASMLSLELADALFRAAGDCHVLLVGDTDQLPPIGPGRVLADLVASAVVPRVHLTAIYRQAARSLIVRSARRINRGEPPYLSLEEAKAELGGEELDEDFFFVSRSGPETLREAVLELVCEALPRRGFDPRTEVMTLVPMRRGPVGLEALNAELEARLNPGDRPVVVARSGLRVGSRIVQTRNDYTPDREVMNGEVAFLAGLGRGGGRGAALARRRRARDRGAGRGARDVRPRVGADRAPRAGLAVPGGRRAVVDAVRGDALAAAALHRRDAGAAAVRPRGRAARAPHRGRARRGADPAFRARRADRRRVGRRPLNRRPAAADHPAMPSLGSRRSPTVSPVPGGSR